MHNIQYSILALLMINKVRRFSELRPDRVDSNLFQYHLKKLITDGYVEKVADGYTLSARGLNYADRHSSSLKAERSQPKIIAIVIVRNAKGEVLVLQKPQQPWLGTYHLPAGKVHDGEPIATAGRRELFEKTGLELTDMQQLASVHVTIRLSDIIVSEYYGVVLNCNYDGPTVTGEWYPSDNKYELCPSVSEVISLLDTNDHGLHEWDIAVSPNPRFQSN
jgi:ADP-ribose pyrophosphatase YjhB (NUDIX family)